MPWLTRDGEVLASVELACAAGDRLRGMTGRPLPAGALLLARPVVLHSIGSPPMDVAFCDRSLCVLATVCLPRRRVARPRVRASRVVVAEAGAFERWRLRPGDVLEVRGS